MWLHQTGETVPKRKEKDKGVIKFLHFDRLGWSADLRLASWRLLGKTDAAKIKEDLHCLGDENAVLGVFLEESEGSRDQIRL
jgi:hypothetical protein